MERVKVRKCKKCGEIYENLSILQCKCGEELPMMPEVIEINEEESAESVAWYKKCRICNTEYKLDSKDQIIFQCEQCGDTDISNQEPYAKSRSQLIGEEDKKKDDFVEQRKAVAKKEKSISIKYVELKNIDDGKIIRIGKGSYMIGKLGEIEPEYFFDKPYVGREHAMIYVEKENVTVMDHNSKNWTRINGKRIVMRDGRKEIKSGDQITLADQTFEVMMC